MFKSIKSFFKYKKILKSNKRNLMLVYNLKKDNFFRLYTVLNMSPNIQETIKTYGYYYMDSEVRKYISSLDKYFMEIGISDMIGIHTADQVAEYSVLIIMSFKYFNTKKIIITIAVLSAILMFVGLPLLFLL